MRIENEPVIVVDMTDHIPSRCKLRLDLNTEAGSTTTIESKAGTAQLVRTRDGIVSRYVIPLPVTPDVLERPIHVRITITNSYGHRATATKEW